MSIEQEQRKLVVKIAQSFISTPYHSHGRKKGIGVDCLTIIAEVFTEAGLVPPVEIPYYTPDFFKHQGSELYLNGLLRYTEETEERLPGNIILWKFGRCFSHAAIIVRWPQVVHAQFGRRVTMENIECAEWLVRMGEKRNQQRPTKIFSYWKKDELSTGIIR